MPDPTPEQVTLAAPSTSPEPAASVTTTAAETSSVDITKTPEFKAALTRETERVFDERLAREREKIRKELAPRVSASPPAPSPSAPADNGEVLSVLAFRDAVEDYHLARPIRQLLESNALAARIPRENMTAWVTEQVETLGLGKPRTDPPAPAATSTPNPPLVVPNHAAPAGPPASDRGGPTATPDAFRAVDPERWTQDHVNRIVAQNEEENLKLGPNQRRKSAGQAVRDAVMSGLKGRTIVFSRDK